MKVPGQMPAMQWVFFWIVAAWFLLTLATGFDTARDHLLVRASTTPVERHLRYDSIDGAPADSFFFLRGSVVIEVPWEMSGAELLDLYRLRNNPAAVEALRTAARGDLTTSIPAGTRVVVELNR